MIKLINLLENVHSDCVILNLFGSIKIHSMIVRCEFVSLEKLNSGLVKLKNYDFVQKTQTFNVFFCILYRICQIGDTINFWIFAHEKGPQCILTFF